MAAQLETRRINMQESRNPIAMRAIEASDAADRRQFEFHNERIRSEERSRDKKHSLVRMLMVWGGGFMIVMVLLTVGAALFGTEHQSSIAMQMIAESAKALGDAGFIFLVIAGVKRLIQQ